MGKGTVHYILLYSKYHTRGALIIKQHALLCNLGLLLPI